MRGVLKVSELGEFNLIELLADIVARSRNNAESSWQQLLLGIGDDTAAWQGDQSIQLLTTDTLVQGVHFTPQATWEELGWKALAVNVSDIAAMGGLPRYTLVSLALPGDIEVESISALYQGMVEMAHQCGVAIVGGDVISAPVVVITVTLQGALPSGSKIPLSRSAASPGDQVAVTGHLGNSAAGLKMLQESLEFDAETASFLRKAHLHPQPRVREGQLLLQQGVKAAIDISDGLIADLRQICKASRVGARIRVDAVPIHPLLQAALPGGCLGLALSGGEDYELLFTASEEVMDKVKRAMSCPVGVIGNITAEGPGTVILIGEKGSTIPWDKGGWDHFRE